MRVIKCINFACLFLSLTFVLNTIEPQVQAQTTKELPIKVDFDIRPSYPAFSQQQKMYVYYGIYNIAALMDQHLNYPIENHNPIVFRLVCNRQIFDLYQTKVFGKAHPIGDYYFYNKGIHEIVLNSQEEDLNLYKGIFHKSTHMIQHPGGHLPSQAVSLLV